MAIILAEHDRDEAIEQDHERQTVAAESEIALTLEGAEPLLAGGEQMKRHGWANRRASVRCPHETSTHGNYHIGVTSDGMLGEHDAR